MKDILPIYKIDDIPRLAHGRVECMKTNPLSKLLAILVEVDVDSDEQIAQELIAEGLSGVSEEDTWLLNSRLDHRHFETHDRHRHRRHYDQYLGLAG